MPSGDDAPGASHPEGEEGGDGGGRLPEDRPPGRASPPVREADAGPGSAGPGSTAPERWSGSPLSVSPAELERVIRRASNLQFRDRASADSALEAGEVVRIGEEVGLEPHYVRQALAELQADSLLPALPREAKVARRLWGRGLVRTSRVVPGERTVVESLLERYLEDEELLKRVRSQPGRSLWEAAGGLLSNMKRAMDVKGHGYVLAKARSVEVTIEPLEPGWCLVTLTADLRNERARTAAGWHLGIGALAFGAAVFLIAPGGPELSAILGSGLAGGAGLGAATWSTGAHFRRTRARLELALEGLLDKLERGRPPGTKPRSWREKLLG